MFHEAYDSASGLRENSIHALRQKVIFMHCRNSLRSETEIVGVSGNSCCRSTVLALCDNNALPRGISLSEFRKDITNEMRNRGRTAEANVRLHLHLTRREISFSGKHRCYWVSAIVPLTFVTRCDLRWWFTRLFHIAPARRDYYRVSFDAFALIFVSAN